MSDPSTVIIRELGHETYVPVWKRMQEFTDNRDDTTTDEIWLVEHDPVFTQGQAGKAEHLLFPGEIPVVQVDRGGQVTYHGPGQQVAYFMIDLRRKNMGPRDLVSGIENAIVDMLAMYGIEAYPRSDAPGVYSDDQKICSLGLRIRKGKSFHGLALNVNMDLEPFSRINPCGYQGMQMTQIVEKGGPDNLERIKPDLIDQLCDKLGYTKRLEMTGLPEPISESIE
ncbi:lipoyl(octanoyl) transferase LipB [Kangiella koreensis]|uniref:Octanoyltransferase n=1 Tax=Kangiella koreensis (strain DSM 16069 / JCM 12317 / KCTC 12182 / SW-125) TaxID=523791 RepID=C7R7K8_KANKD|nr:lipoyl(octanoyl) transferase LipB [Kangiella koreensis]ACV25757.1 lipoate-protein ligase B [Kangiella koreensis DSM 16069]